MPRVLIDATLVSSKRAGLGRYVDGLLNGFAELGAADIAVVCQPTDRERYETIAPSAEVIAGPPAIATRAARMAWEQSTLPAVAEQVAADLIHSPQYSMPLRAGLPVVVTVHDVSYVSHPEVYGPRRAEFYRSATRTAMSNATRIIVPSRATRDALVRLLAADPERIDVAYHGVDPAVFHPPTDDEKRRVLTRLGLDGASYVVFLGALEPRKNVPNLVRGWVQAARTVFDPPLLVLAGGAGWSDEVDEALRAVPEELTVVTPGYVPFRDLPGLYGGATVVAYPSHSEGFGLPLLEAMACRAPVLTTQRLSLPEVGGDAVAYTEPDADSIGAALSALLMDPQRRLRLADAAVQRAAEFSWRASAEAHLEAYDRAVAAARV